MGWIDEIATNETLCFRTTKVGFVYSVRQQLNTEPIGQKRRPIAWFFIRSTWEIGRVFRPGAGGAVTGIYSSRTDANLSICETMKKKVAELVENEPKQKVMHCSILSVAGNPQIAQKYPKTQKATSV